MDFFWKSGIGQLHHWNKTWIYWYFGSFWTKKNHSDYWRVINKRLVYWIQNRRSQLFLWSEFQLEFLKNCAAVCFFDSNFFVIHQLLLSYFVREADGSGILEGFRKNSKAICFFQHYSWYVLWVKLDTKLSWSIMTSQTVSVWLDFPDMSTNT